MADRYALEQIRELIERFSWPMSASREGRFAAVNSAWLGLTGYQRDEVEGRPFTDFVPPEDRRRLNERSQQRRAGAPLPRGPMPAQLLARDGNIIQVLVDVTEMPAIEGQAFAVSTLLRERELQPEMDFALLLVETSADLVSARSVAAVRLAVLERFARGGLWAGFFTLDGKDLVELATTPGAPSLDAKFAVEAVREGRPVFGGLQLAPDCVFLPLGGGANPELLVIHGGTMSHSAAALSLFGKLVISALRSVDDQGRVSRQLTDTRLMLDLARITSGTLELEVILDAACDAMVRLLDVSNCHITIYNPQTRMLERPASSGHRREALNWLQMPVDGDSLSALVARTRTPLAVEDLDHTELPYNKRMVRELGEKALLGVPLVCRDELLGVAMLADTRGPRHFPHESIERAQIALGQVALCMANARLFSSLKQSYAVLAETKAEMLKRERLAGLGELAAIVAHEVRNPLGAIFNVVSCLQPHVSDEPDAKQLMEILRQESERLNTLVTDLLHYARPRAVDLRQEELGPVIRESLSLARLSQSERRLNVTCEIPADLPRVPMDRRMICQALLNVIHNAAQAMPNGGALSIRAARELREQAQVVRIDVSDQGPGIAPDVAARIFEPFFTTKAQGTGLGLALVKRIVADHQGEVNVDSVPGNGTTITFWLPIEAAA